MNRSVSIVVPAYNEETKLAPTVDFVLAGFNKNGISDFEILIFDDASTDKTGEVADNLAKHYPHMRVIHHPRNMGYGATLREGFLNARYDYVMYTDGDNQYDVREFGPYLHLLEKADVLSGYAKNKVVTARRKLQSLVYNLLIRLLFLVNIRDIDCAMKIYKKKSLDSMLIKSTSAFIDAEMLIKAKKGGFKIAQFPVTQYTRKSGSEGGSKWSVVWPTVKDAFKFRLGLH